MELVKKGRKQQQVWRGECRVCGSFFKDTDKNVRGGKVDRCPREQYEFAHRDCPECGAKAGNAVILYPDRKE